MNRRRTDPPNARRPRTLAERVTPLAAATGWALALTVAGAWAPLGWAASPLGAAGQLVAGVLALHALHEAGHVLAGILVGAPLQSVTLGLVTVRRERRGGDGRFRWVLNESWRRFAGCVERDVAPAPGLRRALTVTALAGPAASVLGGAALLALAPEPWATVGGASVAVGVLNALPLELLGQASDGMIVRRLWSRRPEHVAWRAMLCGPDAARDSAFDAATEAVSARGA